MKNNRRALPFFSFNLSFAKFVCPIDFTDSLTPFHLLKYSLCLLLFLSPCVFFPFFLCCDCWNTFMCFQFQTFESPVIYPRISSFFFQTLFSFGKNTNKIRKTREIGNNRQWEGVGEFSLFLIVVHASMLIFLDIRLFSSLIHL